METNNLIEGRIKYSGQGFRKTYLESDFCYFSEETSKRILKHELSIYYNKISKDYKCIISDAEIEYGKQKRNRN